MLEDVVSSPHRNCPLEMEDERKCSGRISHSTFVEDNIFEEL